MSKKRKWITVIAILLLISWTYQAVTDDPVEETKTVETNEEIEEEPKGEIEEEETIKDEETNEIKTEEGRKGEIQQLIIDRVAEKEYRKSRLDKIRVNDNLGEGGEDTYILLINMTFEAKNREKTGNEIMRSASDDMVAYAALNSDDILEAAVFWKDEYNNRNVKYQYIYDIDYGKFKIEDVME